MHLHTCNTDQLYKKNILWFHITWSVKINKETKNSQFFMTVYEQKFKKKVIY